MTFIAAMDHSGGSTGGVLERYGQEYTEDNKMDLVHRMRLRMVLNENFTSDKISHAILYKDSVEKDMVAVLANKGIHAILKVDSGCEANGFLKVFDVDSMIRFALGAGCVGTKMRSIVKDMYDVPKLLDQQFELAWRISNAGLTPIVEPEVPIDAFNKSVIEKHLNEELMNRCRDFPGQLILKLTIPDISETYNNLYEYNSVEKIVGLSGGYSTEEACTKLSRSPHMSASFSRGLSEGLFHSQTDEEFNERIKSNIDMIYKASKWSKV
jgi:fructose-bisphosphate aldolase class I